jgi:hypothetical protein
MEKTGHASRKTLRTIALSAGALSLLTLPLAVEVRLKQATPWETVTIAPNPSRQVIANYNTCMRWSRQEAPLYAYLFWGAEYWILRKQCADSSYLQAFARVLEQPYEAGSVSILNGYSR